jgi:hypothetical protein
MLAVDDEAFDKWLGTCRTILIDRLHCSPEFADLVISGAGIGIYRRQFERGLSPEQCIDLELCYWND